MSDDLRRWYAANPAVHRTQDMLSLDRLRVSAGIHKLKAKLQRVDLWRRYFIDFVRQWQNGLASEVVILIHTLSVEAARAPAKPWTVAPRFPFGKSARDSCSTRGHSAWSGCHPSSVAGTAPLKQTVALQYLDRYIASAPVTSRSGGRRGRRSQSPWELPSPRLRQASSKDAVPRQPETGSQCPKVRRVRQVSGGEIRTCTQDSPPGPMSRPQECETPFKQTPGADMERQGQRAPEAARVARLQPTATTGRPKRAMYVKLAIRRCMRALTC